MILRANVPFPQSGRGDSSPSSPFQGCFAGLQQLDGGGKHRQVCSTGVTGCSEAAGGEQRCKPAEGVSECPAPPTAPARQQGTRRHPRLRVRGGERAGQRVWADASGAAEVPTAFSPLTALFTLALAGGLLGLREGPQLPARNRVCLRRPSRSQNSCFLRSRRV